MSDERVLLVKPRVFVYKIPPKPNARGHVAAKWNLDSPDWTVRMRVVVYNGASQLVEIRLEDVDSGSLFGRCPISEFPSKCGAIEPVIDSSRFFVICLRDDSDAESETDSTRKAYLGLGFSDRSDSFDLNVTLHDHFKGGGGTTNIDHLNTSENDAKISLERLPNRDLAFKDGQTIRISIPSTNSHPNRPKNGASATNKGLPILLAPPPSSGGGSVVKKRVVDALANDEWGEFSSNAAPEKSNNEIVVPTPSNWEQF